LESGITVYPARAAGGRWRAVWYEDGQRRQCQAASEDKLAARLDKVTERLQAGAPNMTRPGADLIGHYLDPDRLPAATRRTICRVASVLWVANSTNSRENPLPVGLGVCAVRTLRCRVDRTCVKLIDACAPFSSGGKYDRH
jgi:hypothetical protein